MCLDQLQVTLPAASLQWVRRPRTLVMSRRAANVYVADVQRFNGSNVRERWLWPATIEDADCGSDCFNGSNVRERWLCSRYAELCDNFMKASMGPTSENAGYGGNRAGVDLLSNHEHASMGPTSENAGYGRAPCVFTRAAGPMLQWVQRPRTPVMCQSGGSQRSLPTAVLQWVQRPRTPVM